MTAAYALLSASAERAVVFDGSAWWELRPDSAEPARADRRASAAMSRFYPDVEEVPPEPWPFAGIQARLALLTAVDRAIVFVTDVLDPARAELRPRAAALAERRLKDPVVADHVEARMFSRRLPEDADAGGALDVAAGHPALRGLLERLVSAQPRIARVLDALDEALAEEPVAVRTEYASELAARDAAGRIVGALERGKPAQAGAWALTPGLERPVVVVAQRWVKRVLAADQAATEQRKQAEAERDESMRKGEAGPRGRRRLAMKLPEILASIERQKAAVLDAVEAGRLDLAEGYADDLAEFHKRVGDDGTFASKSLCDLSKRLAEREPAFAMELARRAVRANRGDAVAWAWFLSCLRYAGRVEEAVACASEAVALAPAASTYVAWAEALRAANRLADANSAYEEALRIDPNNPFAHCGHAEALKALGRLDEALTAYDEALRNDPVDIVARNGRCEVLKALGRAEEALLSYEETMRIEPRDVVARNGRAGVLRALGRLDQALEAYTDALHADPRDVFARAGRAEVLKALGRLDEALAAYNEAVRLHPGDVVLRNGRADVLKTLGRLGDALAAYEEAMTVEPADLYARNGRAHVLRMMGRLEEALAAYDEVASAAPQDVVAHNGRGELLKTLGRFEEALAAYDDSMRVNPKDLVARTGRAEVLKAAGDPVGALAAYDESVRLFPGDIVTRNGRAEVLKALGRFDEALAVYVANARLDPLDVVCRNARARLLAALGRRQAAGAVYREALAVDPRDTYARYGLALLLGPEDPEAQALLRVDTPRTEGDWYLLLGQGLLVLRGKDPHGAMRIATRGEMCPFAAVRERFRTLLGLAALRAGARPEAERILSTPSPLVPARPLCFAEALARRGARAPALATLDAIRGELVELRAYRDLLVRRFGLAGDLPDPLLEDALLEASCDAMAA